MTRIAFPHSHAFHGGRVIVEDEGGTGPSCAVEFSDGVTILAQLEPSGRGYLLAVPAYRTARGTIVRARRWQLVRKADGTWRSERVAVSGE